MKCIDCENILVEYPESQGQSMYCPQCRKVFNADYMKELNSTTDYVNHPPHYNSSKAECPECERRIECIDITRHMNFNIGNAFKYLWRFEHKGGKEDLQKAIWYIQNEIDKK
jgi:phage FluMu protein Com